MEPVPPFVAQPTHSFLEVMEECNESYMESRERRLGFRPQKETPFTKLLPYSEHLDDESQEMLRDIKGQLGKCVLLKELKPGSLTWSIRLQKYIQMFGLKFSKEDHILFIKLTYEILTIANLEPHLVYRFSTCLTFLLKKKELISREDLVLPWRPLYDIYDRLLCSSNACIGVYRYSQNLENALADLLIVARVYFEPSATTEILELWRPQLCPFDSVAIQNAMELMDTFLPSIFLPHERCTGYELWFHEFMDLWTTCHNTPNWEPSMMSLMSRIASHNVGLLNWESYMPLMYTRILRNFSLPVHYKKMKVTKGHKLSMSAVTVWIVATLGGGSSSQMYLTRMMKVIESYFHPANIGTWVTRLRDFLRKITHHFIQRLNMERNHKPSWLSQIPEAAQLTEEDITRFVDCMAPSVKLAIYSRLTSEVSLPLQYLATLRPCTVIPPIIESMYNTLDSLTEPHKYTAAMLSLVSVARPMVEPNDYTEGPTHVIPLLTAILPGIDPNDIRKCFITFQVLTTFTSMIPVVDSSGASEYWKDLTEEEEIVCTATSQLEDLVLEFMDRCFTLVDNSVLENTRLEQQDQQSQQRSRMENVAESALVTTFSCVLCQTSPQIFKSALRKLHTFVTSRILETTVSGKCIASICRTFAKVRPEETLKLLLPHFCDVILSYGSTHEDIQQEENLDNELLYNLLLLSEVVHCYGKFIVGYGELLEKVLDLTLHLKCCEGYTLASRLLNNILSALAATRPHEFKSSNQDYGEHISKFLPVREWGKAYKSSEVQVRWYVPSEVEVKYAEHLIAKYLSPELKLITAYSDNKQSLTREELQCSLSIVTAFLGCGRLLPMWDEPPIVFKETVAERKNFLVKALFREKVVMSDGSNVRKSIASTLGQLQTKLLSCAEDDTKSLNSIANILGSLIMNILPSFEEFEAQTKALLLGKKIFENKLLGKKRHIRSILVNRAFHQHETMIILSLIVRTETHVQIFDQLLELCTSHYSEVRKTAQRKLHAALRIYSDNSTLIMRIIDILKQDSNIHHEKIKGALYVLLGPKDNPLIVQRDWSMVKQLWPVLVRAQPSEKPSVINLLNAINDTVLKQFPTLNIDIEIGDKGEELSKQLWKTSFPTPDLPLPTPEDVAAAKKLLMETNKQNKSDYLEVLDTLLNYINSNLHWRHHFLALNFLQDLVHPDCHYPPPVIRNILQTLIHDNIEFRKIAIRCTVFLLKQQKRGHQKQSISVEHSGGSGSEPQYGDRDDNQWLQYNLSTAPRSQEEWDQPRFVHKQYVGYYQWPKELDVYSPSAEQPALDRTSEELSAGEREVDNFFSDPNKIDKLISYFSLEEKKGKDKFNGMRFVLFKNLFRNYGDKYVEFFRPHLERLIADKHESSQRCAAEIITGIIRGAKHWPYDKVEKMWNFLIPLLRIAFTNMTVETVNDWSIMAATSSENRDPNRHHWFLEFLMEDPLRQESSFIDCGRLSALQGALNQQEWRANQLYNRLLDYLTPKLSDQYQLLRERIGSVLTNVFAPDLPTSGPKRTRGPQISSFVADIMPQLVCLYSLSNASTTNNHKTDSKEESMEVDNASGSNLSEKEKNAAICLLKTMVKWITNSVVRADYSAIPEFFAFLPLVSVMENYEADDELNKICTAMLAAMSQSLTLPEYMSTALAAIQEVSEMSSWSARATNLEFLQVFVFHNMATIASRDVWVNQVNSLVLRLLKDERVEVREMAGQVLSGLIHCGFISDTKQLLAELKRLASKHKSGINEVAKRHAGVLGLCAFISANPYDVVDPIPEIFLMLGSHLNDPQPIPSSIRKTLGDFKRTHHDNWEQHKQKFNEEQLAVLTDLIVPPSYYA